ncbi:MAG: family 10 glycosylhydrolase [bacterium]
MNHDYSFKSGCQDPVGQPVKTPNRTNRHWLTIGAGLLVLGLSVAGIFWACGRFVVAEPSSEAAMQKTMELFTEPKADFTTRENRAIWVTRWDYNTRDDVRRIISNLSDYHFNIVIWQVRGNATVFYKSGIEPWADELGGTDPGWDPLELAITEAHRKEIQFHAWVNTFPAWRGTEAPKNPNHLWNAHRDWFMVTRENRGGKPQLDLAYAFPNPARPEVKAHLRAIVAELAKNYDLDGIHFDYIRYPGENVSYDTWTLNQFQLQTGKTPEAAPEEWKQWRRDQITDLLSGCYSAIKTQRPECLVTAATWGNWNDGYNTYFQDAHGWLARGILDAVCPMIYMSDPETFKIRALDHLYNRHGRWAWPGLGAYLMGGDPRPLLEQVEFARLEDAQGIAVYDYTSLFPRNEPNEMADALRKGPFAEAVNTLPPPDWPVPKRNRPVTRPLLDSLSVEPARPVAGQPFFVETTLSRAVGGKKMGGLEGKFRVGLARGSTPNLLPLQWTDMGPGLYSSEGQRFRTQTPVPAGEPGEILYLKAVAMGHQQGGLGVTHASEETAQSPLVRIEFPYPQQGYEWLGNFGQALRGPQFAAVDKTGRVWVCSWLDGKVAVFNADGSPASFSPITQGTDQEGKPVNIHNPAGVAIDHERGIAYVVNGGGNNVLLRFETETGRPRLGVGLSFMGGDVAVDDAGNLYIVELIRRRWHKLSPDGMEIGARVFSPFDSGDARFNNPNLNRGIAVTPDGATVYVASEGSGSVDVYTRSAEKATDYSFVVKPLVAIGDRAGAVDIGPDGRIYVSDGASWVKVLSPDGKRLTDLLLPQDVPGEPRGVAFTPDARTFYVVATGGFGPPVFIQKGRRAPVDGK